MAIVREEPSKGSKFLNWIFFSVGFSLVPAAGSLLMTWLGRKAPSNGLMCSELLFFSLALTAASIGDLRHVPKPLKDYYLTALNGALVFVGVTVAFLYGSLLFTNSAETPDEKYLANLLGLSRVIPFPIFALALCTQAFVLSARQAEGGG